MILPSGNSAESRRPSLLVGLTGLIMVVADDSMFSLRMVMRGRSSMAPTPGNRSRHLLGTTPVFGMLARVECGIP